MLIDILAGLLVAYLAWSGNQGGAMATLYRAGFSGLALVGAKFLAKPTANYVMKGIEWSAPFAYGLMFLIYFLVLLLVFKFTTASLVRATENTAGDGGILDRIVGTLLGAANAAIIVYGLVAASMLISHRLGARKAMFAFPYDKSYVGRTVMTRNIADPEPFPNAYTLRVIIGAEENQGFNPGAIGLLREMKPVEDVIKLDPAVVAAIQSKDWKSLRTNVALLGLMCSAEFLQYADDFITPRHKVQAEDPSQRFKELQQK